MKASSLFASLTGPICHLVSILHLDWFPLVPRSYCERLEFMNRPVCVALAAPDRLFVFVVNQNTHPSLIVIATKRTGHKVMIRHLAPPLNP
jgi:hypothetical protein